MSKTPPRTVKDTGALADDLLVGITPRNMGIVIRVLNDQPIGEGGRVKGPFELIHWGNGTYSNEVLKAWHIRREFSSVSEFIETLQDVTALTEFPHGLNANGLWQLDASAIAKEMIGVSD